MKIFLLLPVKIIVIVGIISVSSASIFVRLCQQQIPSNSIEFSLFIASSRLIITSLILIPTYKNLRTLNPHNRGIYYSIGAGVCLAFHFATWITSLSLTSVAVSVSLVTTNPLWVALLSCWFFRKKIYLNTIIGISIALTGSILIAFSSGDNNIGSNPFLGAILALMGSWFASGYLLLGTSAQQKGLTTTQYISIAYVTSALCLFPLPLLFGGTYIGYPLSVYGYLILMAIISQIIGHTSLNWSLKHFSPTTVSLIILLEPLISSIFAWWLFQEIPPPIVIFGALLLLIGVAVSQMKLYIFINKDKV